MPHNASVIRTSKPNSWSKRLLLATLLLWLVLPASANNLRITNTRITNWDTAAGTVRITMELAWDNSWRLPATLAPANWDAAWVFVKFRAGYANAIFTVSAAASSATTLEVSSTADLRVGMPLRMTAGSGTLAANTIITAIDTANDEITISNGVATALSNATIEATRIWEHAWLNDTGHTLSTGFSLQAGLADERASGGGFNATTNPGLGVLVYRTDPGSGNVSLTVSLRWNYRLQGIADPTIIDLKANAVEVVFVPEGAFFVGSGGTEDGSFTAANSISGATVPLSLGATAPDLQGNDVGSSAANLSARAAWDLAGTSTATLATDFPYGFAGYYTMKYELSQQQYVDFLNTLGRNQQNARTATDLSAGTTVVTNRYVLSNSSTAQNRNGIRCNATIAAQDPVVFYNDLNGNGTGAEADDGQFLACNYLSWADLAAWLDWAGLRPITETEFEKAARGTENPTANAFPWGNTAATASTGISSGGTSTESSSNAGNAVFGNQGSVQGPMRVGFAATTFSGKPAAGLGFYAAADWAGNVWERAVTLGNADGRAFTGLHGNGLLPVSGDADATNWPASTGSGAGYRGGDWNSSSDRMRISDRLRADEVNANRESGSGGRGARTIPLTAAINGSL